MKKRLTVLFLFLSSNVLLAQQYDRTTNNNRVYTDLTAKTTIDSLYATLKTGQDFGQLATAFSQDVGSYKTGGSLGTNTMDGYVEEYRNAVLTLKPGGISAPFKSDFGYHIVQVLEVENELYTTRHILLRVD